MGSIWLLVSWVLSVLPQPSALPPPRTLRFTVPVTVPPHAEGEGRGGQCSQRQKTTRDRHHQPPPAQPGASATTLAQQAGMTTMSTKPPRPSCPALPWSALLMKLTPSTITPPPPSSRLRATSTHTTKRRGSTSVMAPVPTASTSL